MGKSEATRERLLEAATTEFSTYGVAGARVDRIATAAGCNKNLIYVYFENKEGLFAAVLGRHLVGVYDELEFTPADLPGYAARVFDYSMTHPDVMRLLAWSNLELATATPSVRSASRADKIAEMRQAQTEGHLATTFDPAFLLTMIMTLASAWTAASPFGLSFEPDAAEQAGQLRRSIEHAVMLLTS